MDLLHIFKNKPDQLTELFVEKMSLDKESEIIRLYSEDVDWEEVVDAIFRHEKVVSWW